jgi:hypothetical protein
MIYFTFAISNPFKETYVTPLFFRSDDVFENKAWELYTAKTSHLIKINFALSFKGINQGLYTSFGLFGYMVEFNFYDKGEKDEDDEKTNP